MSIRFSVCFCASLALLISVATSNLQAQVIRMAVPMSSATPVQAVEAAELATEPAAEEMESDEGPAEEGGAGANGKAAKEESPEDALVKLLMAAKYERTSKAILDAWNYREPKDESQKEAAKPQTATVANAFESLVVLKFEKATKFKAKDVLILSNADGELAKSNVLSVEDDGKQVVVKLVAAESDENKKSAHAVDAPATQPAEMTTAKPTADNEDEPKADEPKANEPGPNPVDEEKKENATQENGEGQTPEKTDEPATGNAGQSDPEEANAPSKEAEAASQPVKTAPPKIKTGDEVSVIAEAANKNDEKAAGKKKADAFARNVTLGNWEEVKTLLKSLKPENADKVYGKILSSLASAGAAAPEGMPPEQAAMMMQMAAQGGESAPSQFLTPDDILQLSDCSPKPIELATSKPKKENSDDDDGASDGEMELPPGMLPPGMTIDDLPPEAVAQLKAQMGGGGDGPTASKGGGKSHIGALAKLIVASETSGHDFTDFVAKLESGTTHFGGEDPKKKLTAADLLLKSKMVDKVSKFLPKLEDEATNKNLPALKIWSELALAKYEDKKVAEWLEKAWQINQTIVGLDDLPTKDKDKALSNLIELSPQVDKEMGEAWLNASFTDEPERGMTILTNLGTKSAEMATQASSVSEKERLELLRLQNQAAEKLIVQSEENAQKWKQTLTLLAQNWMAEAETSLKHSKENSRQANMNIDMYGNFYFGGQNQMMSQGGPKPIKLGDMLEITPSEKWQDLVSPSLYTEVRRVIANLHLRVNEEDKAFPYIEEIAEKRPDIARDLIHKFLEIWTRNHDPNTDRNQRNPYIYFYGFDQKADAIPLTRSKQERNLKELSKWVLKIRKMDLEDIDEDLLAGAFTTCHSNAEVFRDDAVKAVFGELKNLKPETIAALAQKMRGNLAANWRDIKQQEAKQTNRREPEVQQEVLRGYTVGKQLVNDALETSPESWQLHLALACLMYDENAYAQTVQKSSEFSNKRDLAFDQFQVAADKYKAIVKTLEEKDHSTDVFDYWFYAGLGACDLGKVTDKTIPDLRQYKKIRAAIEALPGNIAAMHMAKVANNLFTRMSPLKPEIKFRYLRGGFEIVGDHPRAWEARNLHDYYKDLVHEIKLDVQVDGEDTVGHSKPFGIYVNILHTKEIERESGGFSKYAQNQNGMMYAFNYGRPTEDYRDKFNDAVNQAMEEHFEVLNVTFQNAETMESRPTEKDGWRVTPYAYILLKPRGSEVDRVAPLKLDLDFLDTSGYVVIPIESPAIVIDASKEKGTPRPVKDLEITQTLDERQADEGKLIVEITAKAKGLVPDLEDILDLKRDNFEVVSVDDQGVLPESFDPDSKEIQILSDRSWTVQYKAIADSEELDSFTFSDSKMEEVENKFQRYDSADLVAADAKVELERNYAEFSWKFLYWLIPLIVFGLLGVAGLILFSKQPKRVKQDRFAVPEDINPFTVLTLLKDIRRRNGISNEQSIELDSSINRVQEYYFAKTVTKDQEEDLASLASTWVRKAK